MGLDPATALLIGTGLKVGGSIYNRNQMPKTQGKMLRNRMETMEEYGIHPLAAAGMGGGTFSGTGGSNIGSMVADALDKKTQYKDKMRAQQMEDERFDLNNRYMESQIATQLTIAARNQAETRKLEEDSRTPMVVSDDALLKGNKGNAAVVQSNRERQRAQASRIINSFTPALEETMRFNNPFRR